MKFKKSFLLVCMIICLFSIASVAASDANDTSVAVDEQIDVTNVNEDSAELESGNVENLATSPKTFTDLANLIENSGSQINLDSDYKLDCQLEENQYGRETHVGNDVEYVKGIDINKSVTINGNGHKISGFGNTFFNVASNNVVLKDICFECNGNYYNSGQVFSIRNVSNVDIINCNFDFDKDGTFGSIYQSSDVSIRDCNFNDCNLIGELSLMAVTCSHDVKISNCNFINCSLAYDHSGLYFEAGENNEIFACSFINCNSYNLINFNDAYIFDIEANSEIFFKGKNCSITGCIFERNDCNKGLIQVCYDDFKLCDSHFIDNSCTSVNLEGNNSIVDNCIFINNTIYGTRDNSAYGGAINYYGDNCIVSNSKFINSTSFDKGASIYSIGKNMNVDNCSFINNNAPCGSAIFIVDGIVKNSQFASENDIFAFKDVKIIKKSPTLTLNDISYSFNNPSDYSLVLKNGNDPFADRKIILEFIKDDFHITYDMTTSENGIVNILPILKNLEVGTWNVKANFVGDANYDSVSKAAKITINPIAPLVILDDVSTAVNEETTISAVVNRQDNVVVNEGSVKFYVADKLVGSSNVVNNIAKITYCPSNAGNYVLKAVFEDSNYENVQANSMIAVNAAKTEVSQDISYANNQFNYNLPADATGLVTITITSSVYTTTANGRVNADLSKLTSGEYQYVLSYSGDDKYASFTKTGNLNVVGKSTQLLTSTIDVEPVSTVYNGGDNLVATLKDNDGNPIRDVPLTVDMGGLSTILTDNNGQIKVSTNGLAPGSHQAAITFYGTQKFEKTTKKVTVAVKKANPKMTATKMSYKAKLKTKSYVVTLKTNQNKVLKNAKVTLKVNGKTYSASTNSKGQATIKITKLTKKGTFSAVVTYAGNTYYNKMTKTVKITCK